MIFLKYGFSIAIALIFTLGTASLKPAVAQDNRFLETKDFSANYVSNGWADWSGANIFVSFYLKNVSDGGIKVLLTGWQDRDFSINHIHAERCEFRSFGALPILRKYQEETARRIALYIPKGDGLFVTAKAHCENVVKKNHKMQGGIISGRVTVIKGRRVLTRPISGRF